MASAKDLANQHVDLMTKLQALNTQFAHLRAEALDLRRHPDTTDTDAALLDHHFAPPIPQAPGQVSVSDSAEVVRVKSA